LRHADIALTYQGTDITNSIADGLLSFEYDENAQGDADSLTVSMQNKTLKWMNSWLPSSGDKVNASLTAYDWNKPGDTRTLNCGAMIVDEPQFSGPPDKIDIKALNTPTGWNDTPYSKTWSSISLKQLGQYFADKYSLSYTYDTSSDFTISSLSQSSQADADFLNSTANKYNVCMKIYSNKLVLYDKAAYEARSPVATYTLGSSNISGYSLSAPTVGTGYNAAVETYTLNDKTLTYTFRIRQDSVSAPLPMFNGEYKMPDVGDAVVCLFLSNNPARGYCLGTPNSSPAVAGERIFYKDFFGKASIKYDSSTDTLTISAGHVIVNGTEVGS
jgi:uncharacterized protein